MRIVHISTFDCGGAGIACLRVHNYLLNIGIDSKVICYRKIMHNKGVFQIGASFFKKALNKLGIKLGEYRKFEFVKTIQSNIKESVYFSFPTSDYDLANHRLVKEADIVHLHWVANYLDYPSFFSNINKPVVWTFHDSNPILGGFHYPPKAKIPEWIQEIDDEIVELKTKAYAQCLDLSIVCISTMMLEKIKEIKGLSHANKVLIHNGIDRAEFCYRNNEQLRKSLLKDKYSQIILFVSKNLTHELKGLHRIIEAYELLRRENVLLLLVGDANGVDITCKKEFKHFPATNDCLELSTYYSVADLFVLGSSYETFAQTPIEAIMCGTPVVMTPVSGAADLINESNGKVSDDFSSRAMAMAMSQCLDAEYSREIIIRDAQERFEINVIGEQILNYYQTRLRR